MSSFPPWLGSHQMSNMTHLMELFYSSYQLAWKNSTHFTLNNCIKSFPYNDSPSKQAPSNSQSSFSKKTIGGNEHENWALLHITITLGNLGNELERQWSSQKPNLYSFRTSTATRQTHSKTWNWDQNTSMWSTIHTCTLHCFGPSQALNNQTNLRPSTPISNVW